MAHAETTAPPLPNLIKIWFETITDRIVFEKELGIKIDSDHVIDPLWNATNEMLAERNAFCEALLDIAKIRLEPGYCYQQAVRMQDIAKAALMRSDV